MFLSCCQIVNYPMILCDLCRESFFSLLKKISRMIDVRSDLKDDTIDRVKNNGIEIE